MCAQRPLPPSPPPTLAVAVRNLARHREISGDDEGDDDGSLALCNFVPAQVHSPAYFSRCIGGAHRSALPLDNSPRREEENEGEKAVAPALAADLAKPSG